MQIIHAVFAASVMREGFGKELAVYYFSFYSQMWCALVASAFPLSQLIGQRGLGSLSSTAANGVASEG
jgi:hypothetical protein